MVNAFSTTIVNGFFKFQPGMVQSEDCSRYENEASQLTNGFTNPSAKINFNGRTIDFSDVSRLNSEISKDKKFTVYTLTHRDGSLDGRPNYLRYIYERNTKQWTEEELDKGTWHPRIKMMAKAYTCNNIFAVSIVPKNPLIEQTWYLKNLLTHNPMFVGLGTGEGWGQKQENNDGSDPRNPPQAGVLGGFIKPFETFHANKIRPTLDLENLPPEVEIENLVDPEGVESVVNEYYPEGTQPYASSILNSFIEDSEATHLGLLTLNPHKQMLFTK